jgi:hypothetical protein
MDGRLQWVGGREREREREREMIIMSPKALWKNFLAYLEGTIYPQISLLEKRRILYILLKSGRDLMPYTYLSSFVTMGHSFPS